MNSLSSRFKGKAVASASDLPLIQSLSLLTVSNKSSSLVRFHAFTNTFTMYNDIPNVHYHYRFLPNKKENYDSSIGSAPPPPLAAFLFALWSATHAATSAFNSGHSIKSSSVIGARLNGSL